MSINIRSETFSFFLVQSEGVLTELPVQNLELNPSRVPGEVLSILHLINIL